MSKVEKLGRIYGGGPNPAVQSSKDECDINSIMARAQRGEEISHLFRERQAMYGDFTQFPGLREAMIMVIKAKEMFMALDPYVRKRFDNDPAKLVEFVADDRNYDEAVKLGLVSVPVPVAPVEAVKADLAGERPVPKPKASAKDEA